MWRDRTPVMTAPSAALPCDWSVVPESLVMYSGPCEVEAELVPRDGEDDVDLGGKIPFTRHRINDVFPQMRRRGVRGIVSDFLGTLLGVRDPFDLPDAVRWENSALRPGAGQYYHSSADRLDTLSPTVMERIGVLSGTHLYFLAAWEGKAARWLAQVVAGANRQQWQGAQLRLLSGSWPFDQSRTRQWFIEQSALSSASVERFGFPAAEVAAFQEELRHDVSDWCRRFAAAFPPSRDPQRVTGCAAGRGQPHSGAYHPGESKGLGSGHRGSR